MLQWRLRDLMMLFRRIAVLALVSNVLHLGHAEGFDPPGTL